MADDGQRPALGVAEQATPTVSVRLIRSSIQMSGLRAYQLRLQRSSSAVDSSPRCGHCTTWTSPSGLPAFGLRRAEPPGGWLLRMSESAIATTRVGHRWHSQRSTSAVPGLPAWKPVMPSGCAQRNE